LNTNIPLDSPDELRELILALEGTDNPDLSTAPGSDSATDVEVVS